MSETKNAQQRTQELRQKLQAAARARPNRRFHALYDKLALPYILETAWQMVAKNGGAPGVDGVTIDQVQQGGVAAFLEGIAQELKDGTYRAQPVRRGPPGRRGPRDPRARPGPREPPAPPDHKDPPASRSVMLG